MRVVVLSLGSDIVWTLGSLIGSNHVPPVGLHLIMDIPPGSKVRYPDFVGSPLRVTLVVPPV